MKLLVGIVLFNPEIEILEKNIKFIKSKKIDLVLIDNNSNNIDQIEEMLDAYSKVQIIKNMENKGIAYALNQIMKFGKEKNTEWCLLMDQDSELSESFFEELYKMEINDEDAIITPKIIDNSLSIIYDSSENIIEVVDKCITSGSLNRISVWEEVNGFDEHLFIDGVDHDYCIRVTKQKYKIKKNNKIFIKHKIGDVEEKQIFGYKYLVFHHNAFRKFYIVRNIIYLNNKHGERKIKTLLQLMKQISIVVLFESEKKDKLINMFKGIKDGKKLIRGII